MGTLFGGDILVLGEGEQGAVVQIDGGKFQDTGDQTRGKRLMRAWVVSR